jgi:hypothetical protein
MDLDAISADLANGPFIGPIYGLPDVGDVDFTAAGASCFEDVHKVLFGPHVFDTFGYHVKDSEEAWYFVKKDAAAQSAWQLVDGPPLEDLSRASPIGPWCVYWWLRFAEGYRLVRSRRSPSETSFDRETGETRTP